MRFIGVNIPDDKKIKIALTRIYGIGRSLSLDILAEAKVDPEKRTKDLESSELNELKTIIEKQYRVEGELRQVIKQNINRLKSLSTRRGERHSRGLPVRGQSTKRNSRTVRGNVRQTAGSGKRKLTLK